MASFAAPIALASDFMVVEIDQYAALSEAEPIRNPLDAWF
jgi:hypothetical protein